jgi:hypothetical protein
MRLFTRQLPPSPPPLSRHRAAAQTSALAPEPSPADDRPAGCGWFDSSHDLQHGLRVTEHADADAVARLVPLSWWLAWELDAALASSPARARA